MSCIMEFGLLQPSFSTIHYVVCRKQAQETWSQETWLQETGSSNPCRKLGRRKQVVVGSSITVNKPQGFSKGHSVVWVVERGTRAETDLSCLTDPVHLGLISLIYPGGSQSSLILVGLSLQVILLEIPFGPPTGNSHLSSGYLKHVPALSVHYIICTLKMY